MKKRGKAYELKKQLDNYIRDLNIIGKRHEVEGRTFVTIEKIAKDGKEIPEYTKSKEISYERKRKERFCLFTI